LRARLRTSAADWLWSGLIFTPFRATIAILISISLAILSISCGGGGQELLLGATTSIDDSGLLDELVEAFEDGSGYHVKPIVQGSGQILELARNGELDVTMTHSPSDEEALVDDSYGAERTPFMQNYFELVGPEDDPVGVGNAASIADALRAIAESGSLFVSRGDQSGTHKRERAYWAEAGIEPGGNAWYSESATGQGQTLSLASDRSAYTLVDSSTFATMQDRLNLSLLLRDEQKPNVYSVVRLNSARLTHVNDEAAHAWIEFITGDRAQQIIAQFGVEEYGEALFKALLLN
jgi:tungstate transport system substrate-binding protein